MHNFAKTRVFLVIAIMVLGAGSVSAESDDVAGRLVVGAPGPSTVQVDSRATLTTLFATDNNYRGNTFDIENTSASPITISGWDVNLDNPGATVTIDIYWRTGTCDGFQSNPAGWTLLGSDTLVVSAGTDLPTPVTMPPFTLQPGELFGFYADVATYDGTTHMLYTNGGPTVYQNGELSLTTYYGQGDPAFGPAFPYRAWNGSVHYDVVPVELQSFSIE